MAKDRLGHGSNTGIVHENGDYHVKRDARNKGYEVFKAGPTAATKVASIGDVFGMERVHSEIAKRQAMDKLGKY